MQEPALSPSETARLAALHEYDVLDTPSEAAFDRITQLAAELFDAPMALVTLIDAERQWMKSAYGLTPRETRREDAFCNHTIRSDEVLVVPDATADPRFRDSALVTTDPKIRFYVGAPLTSPDGQRLGALCVLDQRPRPVPSTQDQHRLSVLAAAVVSEMNLRLATRRLDLARRQAEAFAEARSEFLANMSHELRTPLTSIIGYAGILAASTNLPERERQFAGKINGASQALLAMVNDVLDLARLDSDPEDEPHGPTDVGEVARGVLDLVAEQARAKGLELRFYAPSRLPHVRAPVPRLRQVLLNLLSNAVKFTESGHVAVSVEVVDGRLAVHVADTGIGIAADRLDVVFERFVQADSTVAKRFGGVGLGLTIARRMAERMAGKLSVKSELGRGSVFTLSLPVEAAA